MSNSRSQREVNEIGKELSAMGGPVDTADLSRLCEKWGVQGHLAVLNQPYLDKIISNEKVIESRFSKVRCAPFRQAQRGQIVFLKESGGPIKAIAEIAEVAFHDLVGEAEVKSLINKYATELALEQPFVEQKRESKYASLLHLGPALQTTPVAVIKSDRRAWVVLDQM